MATKATSKPDRAGDPKSSSREPSAAGDGSTDEKSTVVYQPEREKAILWARLQGFPPWPGRYCTVYEELTLVMARKPPANCVPVLFFGSKGERSWVPVNSVCTFDDKNWREKFSPKLLKDKEYVASIREALVVAMHRGEEFGDDVMVHLKDYNRDEGVARCELCTGGACSGHLLECHYCEAVRAHWHCFGFRYADAEEHGFACRACCKKNGMQEGTIVRYYSSDEDAAPSESADRKDSEQSTSAFADSKSKKRASGGSGNSKARDKPKDLRGRDTSKDKKKETPREKDNERERERGRERRRTSNAAADAVARRARGEETPESPAPPSAADSVPQPAQPLSLRDIVASVQQERAEARGAKASDAKKDLAAAMEEESEDSCQVCGLEGEVLLCDYPGCRKVYHRICVAKVIPFSLLSPEAGFDQSPAWFCPRHHCQGCGSLQALPASARLLNLPPALCSFVETKLSTDVRQRNVYSVLSLMQQASVVQCTSCALALCGGCQHTMSPRYPLIAAARSGEEPRCLNCAHPSAEQRLARLLEQGFVKMASPGLALPFLRPVLPLRAHGRCSSPAVSAEGPARAADLLEVWERIHSAHYSSPGEMIDDVRSLAIRVEDVLSTYLGPTVGNVVDLARLAEFQDVTMSFSSILELMVNYFQLDTVKPRLHAAVAEVQREKARAENPQGSQGAVETRIAASATRTPKRARYDPVVQENQRRTTLPVEAEAPESQEHRAQALQLMRRLWRVECHRSPWANPTTAEALVHSAGGPHDAIVPARSLSSWLLFIRRGATQHQQLADEVDEGQEDGVVRTRVMKNEVSRLAEERRGKEVAYHLLMEEAGSAALGDALVAAEMMTSMQFSALRESTSLPAHPVAGFFDASLPRLRTPGGDWTGGVVAHGANPLQAVFNSSPLEDEALVCVDRLQELCQHALLLQTKIKGELLRRKREVALLGTQTVSIGEASLIAELKLANDVLRAQLKHKNDLIYQQRRQLDLLRGEAVGGVSGLMDVDGDSASEL